jgi:hypothetical protein
LPALHRLPGRYGALTFAAPNFRNPYSEQGTASVQRQMGAIWIITASYVYTRGLHLITYSDVNLSNSVDDGDLYHRRRKRQ